MKKKYTHVETVFGWDLCRWRRVIPYTVNSDSFFVIAGFGFNLVLVKEYNQCH